MFYHRLSRIAAFAGALALSACAAAAPASEAGRVPTGDTRNEVLTETEIRAAGLPNAYELVSRQRRAWLRRDAVTGSAVRVYLDNREIGGAEALRDIPAVDVAELRYYDNDAAMARWGQHVEGSVIEVVRR